MDVDGVGFEGGFGAYGFLFAPGLNGRVVDSIGTLPDDDSVFSQHAFESLGGHGCQSSYGGNSHGAQ